MSTVYELEKKLWTETDFDLMSWHDCSIHAISFHKEHSIIFDIDYIFEWVLFENASKYKFWVSPCTLVFENVYNISFESEWTAITIDNITRENPQSPKNAEYLDKKIEYDWMIETTAGEISFKSIGFKQFVRQSPVLTSMQELDIEARKGINFNQIFFS